MLFSTGVRKHCYKRAYHARERGQDMYAGGYVCGRRAGRAYLLSKRKNEKCGKMRVASMQTTARVSVQKNGSGEHTGNRSGEHVGGARESKRNDWRESCESAGEEMVET